MCNPVSLKRVEVTRRTPRFSGVSPAACPEPAASRACRGVEGRSRREARRPTSFSLSRISRLLPLLLVLSLLGCAVSPSDWLFDLTGEEELPHQGRGVLQLAGNLLRPQPRTARYEPVAHAGVNPFGINVFLEQEVETEKREQTVQMITAAGFHWLRQSFPWEDIEIHGRGDFEDRRHEPHRSAWEKYDHIVALGEQYGLEVVAVLGNPPDWSRADGDARGTSAPPDSFEDFGDYVYAVAARYRGRIRHYQIWNEPNIYPEWGDQPVDPEAYTRLLCLAYRRIKEADPDAVVVSAALAQTQGLEPENMSDLVFLQRMYDAGAADCFDVLAVNVYMLWSGPTDHRLRPLTFVDYARPLYLRDIMVANGDASKPIWFSEMNSNAIPLDHPAYPTYGRVTLEQQARYAPLAYQRAIEEWPWVGVINFWFFKRATDAERDQAMYYFRMAEPDFTTLPVYDTMREYIAGFTPALYSGTHQEHHWALAYEGAWETVTDAGAVLGAYRRAEEPGAAVSFIFEGSNLTLVPGPGSGEIEVVIDDGAPQTVALDGRPVRLFSSWAKTRHHAQIATVAGQVGIDSLTVREPDWGRRVSVGLVTLLALGLSAGIVVRRRQPADGRIHLLGENSLNGLTAATRSVETPR